MDIRTKYEIGDKVDFVGCKGGKITGDIQSITIWVDNGKIEIRYYFIYKSLTSDTVKGIDEQNGTKEDNIISKIKNKERG